MKKNIIDKIEEVVQYRFSDKSLLVQAFTHSSYANMENTADNERMEFFGDAILEYLSSEYLFDHYRTLSEGELSTIRAKIVSAEGLYPVVERLGLMQYLQVLTAELSRKTAANLYEAVLCAIYLDGGMSKARDF